MDRFEGVYRMMSLSFRGVPHHGAVSCSYSQQYGRSAIRMNIKQMKLLNVLEQMTLHKEKPKNICGSYDVDIQLANFFSRITLRKEKPKNTCDGGGYKDIRHMTVHVFQFANFFSH
ncbi:2692_t:CDS:2, partial [Acaulospora morrowiae]